MFVIAISKVSATWSVSVTDATPAATVTVIAVPGVLRVPEKSVPVTTLATVPPAVVGENVICVALSRFIRLPSVSRTSTVSVVLAPAMKLAPAAVMTTSCAAAKSTMRT